jgi:site-specific recombinase XerD
MTTANHQTFEETTRQFLRHLDGRNTSVNTRTAYAIDVRQFIEYIREVDVSVTLPQDVTRSHLIEYLSHLSDLGRSGVTRARKLAALQEYFKFLVSTEQLEKSPAINVAIPKREKKQRTYLRPDEYTRMLSSAGSNARDYAILQLFLQTGIRVSELAGVKLSDIDLTHKNLRVYGKGGKERNIPLEKQGIAALKNYLSLRPQALDTHLFLNYEEHALSTRGIMKIVEKYVKLAGISKNASCHSLRHTFATYKAK